MMKLAIVNYKTFHKSSEDDEAIESKIKSSGPGIEGWSKWVPPEEGQPPVPPEGYEAEASKDTNQNKVENEVASEKKEDAKQEEKPKDANNDSLEEIKKDD